jgi:hypothetical protein
VGEGDERGRGRAILPPLVAGLLWLITSGIGTVLTYQEVLPPALVQIVLPNGQQGAWLSAAPRNLVEPLAPALLVGALVAVGAAVLRRRSGRWDPATYATWWFMVVLAATATGLLSGLGQIVAAWPPMRARMVFDPLPPYLQQAALWGVVWGWLPALIARPARAAAATSASRPRRALPLTAAIAVLAAIAVVAAPALPTAPAPVTEAAPNPAPTRDGPTVPPVAPGQHVVPTDWCSDEQVEVAVVRGDAAMGHRESVLSVTNRTGVDCSVRGYPDLAFADATEALLPVHIVHGDSFMAKDPGPTTVLLKPGRSAISTIGWDAQANDPENTARYVHLAAYAGAERAALPFTGDVVRGCSVGLTAWRAATPADFSNG